MQLNVLYMGSYGIIFFIGSQLVSGGEVEMMEIPNRNFFQPPASQNNVDRLQQRYQK